MEMLLFKILLELLLCQFAFDFFFHSTVRGPVNTAPLVSVSEWTFKLMHEKECMNEGVHVCACACTELRK